VIWCAAPVRAGSRSDEGDEAKLLGEEQAVEVDVLADDLPLARPARSDGRLGHDQVVASRGASPASVARS